MAKNVKPETNYVEKIVNQTMREVNLLARLENPNVLKYYESFMDKELLNIIMEYCDVCIMAYFNKKKFLKCGILDNYIQNNLTENTLRIWIQQIASALEHVHSKNIIHHGIILE